jgi:hypothetical protein
MQTPIPAVAHTIRSLLAVGAENLVTLCELGVFVDQAAEPVASQHADSRLCCGGIGSPGGRILVQCPVWPVSVVVIDVLAEDEPQMPPAISIGSRPSRRALPIQRSALAFARRLHRCPGRSARRWW